MKKIKVAIVGVRGHVGIEVAEILCKHPNVQIVYLAGTEEGRKLGEYNPEWAHMSELVVEKFNLERCQQEGVELAFLCLPHQTAMSYAKVLYHAGIKVIDLSADFRIKDVKTYEKWYQQHSCPELLSVAVYGTPEINREEIKKARLLANPGCYVTSATLALYPLTKQNLIETGSIIIDAKSGYSGAGRTMTPEKVKNEVENNFKAYGVMAHRHQPEIEQNLGQSVVFTPHLLPIYQGILCTTYAKLNLDMTVDELNTIYEKQYSAEPFVEFKPAPYLPEIKEVQKTNFCRMTLRYNPETRQIIVISVLDNLIKGAAGQGVQNMNIMFGFDEETGFVTGNR